MKANFIVLDLPPIVAYAKNRLLDHQMRFLFPTHKVAKL
jgi:hypothetical protein